MRISLTFDDIKLALETYICQKLAVPPDAINLDFSILMDEEKVSLDQVLTDVHADLA